MRVAYLAELFPVRAETPYLNIATGLLRRGHDVQAFAVAGQPGHKHPDVAALDLMARTHYPAVLPSVPWWERAALASTLLRETPPAWRRLLFRALDPRRTGRRAFTLEGFFEAARFVGKAPFDVAYCALGREGREAVRLRRVGALDAPFAVSFRGLDITREIRRRGPRLYREVFREASLLLPMCRAFERRLLALGAPRERIVVHPTGIDVRRFAFRAPVPPAEGEPLRLVSVARLREKKGLLYGIRAVARLRATGLLVRYDLVGDGPMRARLEREIEAAGVQDSVHLRGALPHAEVRALIAASHLLLAPSVVAADGDEEGVPTVIKEAMSVGVPVVATRHSGIPEVVIDGETGRLVPERDDEALARAIAELHECRDTWGALAARGRALVGQEYDIERLNDRLVELLASISRPSR